MDQSQLERIESFVAPFRVESGAGFSLKDIDPADTGGLTSADKGDAPDMLDGRFKWLGQQQEMLYAQDHWALLLVFQAMDAAGKDGTIKHVMSGIDPKGCEVASFKQPSVEELDHDYLWRYMPHVPARGQIGIFNRSYYEEVLVVKVHQEFLAKQKLPPSLVTQDIWNERYEDIANFERYLTRNGVRVLKFFLHVSKTEQKRRFIERYDNPDKNWKFTAADIAERQHWADYQDAYEQAIRHTSSKHAPWYVVPADNKWFTRMVVTAAVVKEIAELKLHYPLMTATKRAELDAARARLDAE